MAEYVKPVDYYDRIADALEIISGDNSHINDEYPTMDYYDRIADALEAIVQNGIGNGSSSSDCNCQKMIITTQEVQVDNERTAQLNSAWQEIYDNFAAGNRVLISDDNTGDSFEIVNSVYKDGSSYVVLSSVNRNTYLIDSPNGNPCQSVIK